MKHSIKITHEVYQALLSLQRPRETFSQVIERLLQVNDLLVKAEPFIRGQQAYLEWQRAQGNSRLPSPHEGTPPVPRPIVIPQNAGGTTD